MQWDEKELDTQFIANVYFWTPNSEILAKALSARRMIAIDFFLTFVQQDEWWGRRYLLNHDAFLLEVMDLKSLF